MHEEKPGLRREQDSVIAPLKFRGFKNSGVYGKDGRLIGSSVRIRGDERVEGELPQEYLHHATSDRRSAYYLGAGEKHYGHFLLEVLCRAWAWEEFGGDRVPVLQLKLPSFARALYALIPGLSEKIEILSRPTRFSDVIVPDAAFVIRRKAYREFKRLCERMADAALPSRVERSDQPLYFSRAGVDWRHRTLAGEMSFERILEKEGFLIVRPETLPVNEQIALVNRHRWIVSTMGSACHTRIFARGTNNQVTIVSPAFNQNHVLCDYLCEGASHYVNALERPDIGTEVSLQSAEPLMLDHARALTALKTIGLVRPSTAAQDPAPDLIEYKRRWLTAARGVQRGKSTRSRAVADAIDIVRASIGEQGWPSRIARIFRRH